MSIFIFHNPNQELFKNRNMIVCFLYQVAHKIAVFLTKKGPAGT